MLIAGREVGNQVVYDLLADSGSSPLFGKLVKSNAVKQHAQEEKKAKSLEEQIKKSTPELLIRAHEEISDYVSFIKSRPEANKENYETQHTLIDNISDLVQPIIVDNSSEEYSSFLTDQLQQMITDSKQEIAFIQKRADSHIVGTNKHHLYELETGKHIDYVGGNMDTDLVGGAGAITSGNRVFVVIDMQGTIARAHHGSSKFAALGGDPKSIQEARNRRQKNNPYTHAFTYGNDAYAQNKNGLIINILTGEVHNTPELQEQAKNPHRFTYKNQEYEFDSLGNVHHLAAENQFSHTQAYKTYLEELL